MQIVFRETVCMKFQNPFSGKKTNKNVVNLPSAEIAQRVIKVNNLGYNTMNQYTCNLVVCSIITGKNVLKIG